MPIPARARTTPKRPLPYGTDVQYARGTNVRNVGVTNVVNTQDSQEQAPCAMYGFLGLIQVPYGRLQDVYLTVTGDMESKRLKEVVDFVASVPPFSTVLPYEDVSKLCLYMKQ
eukprot:4494599-Pyramimonas_sp.AAC.2